MVKMWASHGLALFTIVATAFFTTPTSAPTKIEKKSRRTAIYERLSSIHFKVTSTNDQQLVNRASLLVAARIPDA
jgi:hypothetical protein